MSRKASGAAMIRIARGPASDHRAPLASSTNDTRVRNRSAPSCPTTNSAAPDAARPRPARPRPSAVDALTNCGQRLMADDERRAGEDEPVRRFRARHPFTDEPHERRAVEAVESDRQQQKDRNPPQPPGHYLRVLDAAAARPRGLPPLQLPSAAGRPAPAYATGHRDSRRHRRPAPRHRPDRRWCRRPGRRPTERGR